MAKNLLFSTCMSYVWKFMFFSLWQFCNEYAVPKDKLENFKDVTPQDIVCSQVLIQTLLHKYA